MDQPTPATGAQQPTAEPEERRTRYATAVDSVGYIGDAFPAVLDAVIAVADEEGAELQEMVRNLLELVQKRDKEITHLCAELGQARGTTGQDTTVPADGEEELRQQIRLACARAENVPVTILEPHDYQEHATAVLPVVRAAVAAGVRRALEDAAADFDQFPTNTARVLRARAAAVAPPASERVRVCDNCGVAHQSVACHPEAYANCEQGDTA